MAKIADRVKETTLTTGTGPYTLVGPLPRFIGFADVVPSLDGQEVFYAVEDAATGFEVGRGTYALAGNTISRTEIILSSNGGAAVNWGAGAKSIWSNAPARLLRNSDAAPVDNQLARWDGVDGALQGSGVSVDDTGNITVAGRAGIAGQAVSASTALITPAGTTGVSSLRLPHGVAPTAPVNGDMWTDTVALNVRINGVTITLTQGVTDHGALTGLGDDDHPQYVTHAEGDAAYSPIGHVHSHASLTGLGNNDHPQYLLVTNIDDVPVDAVTTRPISSNWAFDHGAAADPHPQYLTAAEGSAAFDPLGAASAAVAAHEAAGDPHPGYRLESADHNHQSTGLQGGQLDHGLALTGLGDDDHPQYILATGTRAFTGNVIFSPDNTHNIGAPGADRPASGHFGTSVFSPVLTGSAAAGLTLNVTQGAAVSTGGAISVTSGAGGGTSGNSGAVTVASGATTDGDTGAVTVRSANATGTNRSSGAVAITTGAKTGTGLAGVVTFNIGEVEFARFDTLGVLKIGTVNGVTNASTIVPKVIMAGSGVNQGLQAVRTGTPGTGGAQQILAATRGADVNAHTILQVNDGIGTMAFYGSDGVDYEPAAQITVQVDSAPSANTMFGRIVFSVANGTGTNQVTEALRIDRTQRITMGGPNTAAAFEVIPVASQTQWLTTNGAITAGTISFQPNAAATVTSVGAALTISAGPGGTTSGAGGALIVQGGVSTSGAGGAATFRGRGGTGTNQVGGAVTVNAGNSTGSAAGGNAVFSGGAGGATGTAGTIVVEGGAGGSTSGAGGSVTIRGGSATDGNGGAAVVAGRNATGTNRAGGALTLTSGNSTGTANGADITITAGTGGASGDGGLIFITGGSAGATGAFGGSIQISGGVPTAGDGGSIAIQAAAGVGTDRNGGTVILGGGASTGTSTGGSVLLEAGAGGATGEGGPITATSGPGGSTSGASGVITIASGATTDGNTGAITIKSENATGTNRSSGSVTVRSGTKTGSGVGGDLIFQTDGTTRFTITGAGDSNFAGKAGVDGQAATASTSLATPAATTAKSSIRLPHGAAPTAPVDGDMWTTTAGLFVRINGVTVGPLT